MSNPESETNKSTSPAETPQDETQQDLLDIKTSRKLFDKRAPIIGLTAFILAGLAGAGIDQYRGKHKDPSPNETSRVMTPEKAAEDYPQEALSFAKTTIDKLSNAQVETNPQGSENTVYQLSNIPESELRVMEPGEERKRIVVTLSLGKHSLDITGVEESRNEGMKNQIQTTFELDEDNPVFDANPDAPVTYQDFVTAINGVEMDDVRSIIVFGQGIDDQINSEFAPGKAPEFTNGENTRTDIPTREQIHTVAQAVQP